MAHRDTSFLTPVSEIKLEFVDSARTLGGDGSHILNLLERALEMRSDVAARHAGGARMVEDDDDDYYDEDDMEGGAAKKAKSSGTGRGQSPGFLIYRKISEFLRDSGEYPDINWIGYMNIGKMIVNDVKKEMNVEKVDQAIFDKILARAKLQHAEYVRKYRAQQKAGADRVRCLV